MRIGGQRPVSSLSRSPRTALAAALILAGAALVALLGLTDALHPVELATIDARFALRGERTGVTSHLLIVAIDPRALRDLGRFPIPRRHYGEAVLRLRRAGARSIVLDVQITEPGDPDDDDALISDLRRAPGTILVTTETRRGAATPVLGGPDAQRYARVRVASGALPEDAGGTLRRFELDQQGLPTVAVRAAHATPRDLGPAPVWIDYAGGAGTVDRVSLSALLHGEVPATAIRGRTVIIGATAPSLQDLHTVSVLGEPQMSGPEIQANAIATALQGAPLRSIPGWLAVLIGLLATCGVPVVATRRRPSVGALVLLAAALALCAGAFLAFLAGAIVPLADPLAGLVTVGAMAIVGGYVLELRRRTAQVRVARARAVEAADDARRRVERDLHDGAQQRLLALAMMLSGASGEPPDRDVMRHAVDEVMQTLAELRELARGVYPAVLTEAGLVAALETLAERSALAVRVRTAGAFAAGSPLAEQTAYFIAAEALANATKHAGAGEVVIEVRRDGRDLHMTISDDGAGGADPSGSGLSALAERAEAAGGRLRIESPAGAGTRVVAVLPAEQPDLRAHPQGRRAARGLG